MIGFRAVTSCKHSQQSVGFRRHSKVFSSPAPVSMTCRAAHSQSRGSVTSNPDTALQFGSQESLHFFAVYSPPEWTWPECTTQSAPNHTNLYNNNVFLVYFTAVLHFRHNRHFCISITKIYFYFCFIRIPAVTLTHNSLN